jgi:hypothetical protein
MSGWKEVLHDELDGLTRAEQIEALMDAGWPRTKAVELLERQHIYARGEEVTDEDPDAVL